MGGAPVDHRFRVSSLGREYELVLPDAESDWIQSGIRTSGEPYEHAMLVEMHQSLQHGATVVDAGANVGNHAIYLALMSGANVWAFEPDAHLVDAITESAKINGIEGLVHVVPHALGETRTRGFLVNDDETNLGAQHLSFENAEDSAEIEVDTLDNALSGLKVDALKIDVEGSESAVLRGGMSLIRAHLPDIWVECLNVESYESVVAILGPMGYQLTGVFNASPTLRFQHAPPPTVERDAMDAVIRRMFVEHGAFLEARATNFELRGTRTSPGQIHQSTDVEWRLRAELDAAHAALQEYSMRQTRAQQDFSVLRRFVAEAVDWEIELVKRREQATAVEAELDRAAEELRAEQMENARLTTEIEAQEAEFARISEDLAEKTLEAEDAFQRAGQQRAANERLAKEIAASRADVDDLSRRLQWHQVELQQTRAKLEGLRSSRTYRLGIAIREIRTLRGAKQFLPRVTRMMIDVWTKKK